MICVFLNMETEYINYQISGGEVDLLLNSMFGGVYDDRLFWLRDFGLS